MYYSTDPTSSAGHLEWLNQKVKRGVLFATAAGKKTHRFFGVVVRGTEERTVLDPSKAVDRFPPLRLLETVECSGDRTTQKLCSSQAPYSPERPLLICRLHGDLAEGWGREVSLFLKGVRKPKPSREPQL